MRSNRLHDRSSRRRRVTTHLTRLGPGAHVPHVIETSPESPSHPTVASSTAKGTESTDHSGRSPETSLPGSQRKPSTEPPGSKSSAAALALVGERLRQERSLTWVIAGDNLVRPEARISRTLPQALSAGVRSLTDREQDVFLDLTRFGQKIKPSLVTTLLDALVAEQADLLVLFCGNRDAMEGLAGFQRFEDSLNQLLFQATQLGVPVILNTPPCLKSAPGFEDVDRMVYQEMILSTSIEYDALLVDHWSHWEWGAIENGSLSTWLGTDPDQRAEKGLEEICALTCRELRLAQGADQKSFL